MPPEFATLHGLETETGTSSRTIIINISSRTEQTEQRRKEIVTCKWTMQIPASNPVFFFFSFFHLFLIIALLINLTGLRKQCDHYNCSETGHDNSSINEIVEISYRTNKHGFFMHPSTDCAISYLEYPNCYCVLSIFNKWFCQTI